MKIGIASCYYNRNYGSMLQAYATQKIVEKMGHMAVTIQCLSPINYMMQSKLQYYIHKLGNIDIIKSKIRQHTGKLKATNNDEYMKNIRIRNEKFDNFYKQHIHLSKLNKTRDELVEMVSGMDAVIVGSDMLWHPINIEHDYYTLTFVPDSIKKISYATSFGTTVIPKYQRIKVKEFLERFNSISVREQSGIKVISDLGVDKSIQVVLDPTLLFTAEEWMDIQDPNPIISQKYIFCYFLGVNQEHRYMAQRLQILTGYKIVTLPHLDEYVINDEHFGDYRLFDVGPSEFVNLIRNAEFILTDSFHGTCFSILNNKRFATFNRFQEKNSQSTNTRIDSLLHIVNLEDRHVEKLMSFDNFKNLIEERIDYDYVNKKIAREREESIHFLNNALGDTG